MLSAYKKKRDFTITSEPSGDTRRVKEKASKLSFVIQKHAASHLHYDFRLELDGVLKSWAVPKGPSLDPDRKSLAIEVEDHPLEYGGFEGTIPKGQYGGGSVLLWDRGTWEPLQEPREAFKDGKLHFILHGQKLKGEWILIRFHGPQSIGKPQWLLRKARDEFASTDRPITEERPESVKSNRLIESIGAKDKTWDSNRKNDGAPEPAVQTDDAPDPPKEKKKAKPRSKKAAAEMPADIKPQLATWVQHPPSGEDWLHEVKLDGYRLIVRVNNGQASLITRGGEDWTHRFPRLAKELSRLPAQAILDGEVVVVDEEGRSHFQLLQNSWKNGQSADPIMYVFDLLYLDGKDLREQPLLQRKEQLKTLLDKLAAPRVKFSDHVRGNGDAVVDAACKMSLEGIISKQADSRYTGGRTRAWLKSKCGYRQEFVILGYTDPKGSRQDFGSVLLGYHDKDGKLVYAGRVGTGFDSTLLKKIKQQMDQHARPTPPTDIPPPPRERREAHWIAPRLIAEIKFAGWTQENLLRQGTFLGLREDKKSSQIVREDQPQPKLTHKRVKDVTTPAPEESPALKLTHPDRVIFPGTKITKQTLAAYYELVAARMLPHVIDRPLTVMRYPGGIAGPSFIQRHFTDNLPPAIESIKAEKNGAAELYLMIRGSGGLRGLVQMNAIEIHAWGCAPADVEHPDRLVFDLDPDEALPWKTVVKAARDIKDILESVKLRPLVKTTGGKGLHVVVPIEPNVQWDRAKDFCKSIAEELARRDPKSYTTNLRKAERPGRVFIDYLRNGRSATSVAPYSVRAREGAPVSMPVQWDELPALKAANRITVDNVQDHFKRAKDDPWAEFDSHRVDLHKAVGA